MADPQPIKSSQLEQDVAADRLNPQSTAVRLLRIMLSFNLLFSLLGFAELASRFSSNFSWYHTLPTALVWLWLMLPSVERRLGRRYLPISLGLVISAQCLEYALSLASVSGTLFALQSKLASQPGTSLTPAPMVEPLLLLVVATAIGTWVYGRRGFQLTIGLAASLLILIDLVQIVTEPGAPIHLPLVSLNIVLLVIVSYIVLTLAEHDRRQARQLQEQAAALGHANVKLREQASVAEQLATARERNRLARDLHDTLAHSLAALIVELDVINTLLRSEPDAAEAELITARAAAHEGLQDARQAIRDLRVSPIEDLGLRRALERAAFEFGERTGLKVDRQIADPPATLSNETATQIWRIAQEALNNVERHAGAQQVSIDLQCNHGQLALTISDDGRGFEATTVSADRFGLTGMRERAAMIGGQLEVDSAIEHGTTVQLSLPIGV